MLKGHSSRSHTMLERRVNQDFRTALSPWTFFCVGGRLVACCRVLTHVTEVLY